jgi:hypothetical protein
MFSSVFQPSLFKPTCFKSSLSRPVMALAAALALSLPAATDALAQYRDDSSGDFRAGALRGALRGAGFGRGGYPGGFRSDEFGPPPGFAGRRGPAFRDGFPDDYPPPFAVRVYHPGYYEYYYYGCYRGGWSATPWGWRWRRVNICHPSDED